MEDQIETYEIPFIDIKTIGKKIQDVLLYKG